MRHFLPALWLLGAVATCSIAQAQTARLPSVNPNSLTVNSSEAKNTLVQPSDYQQPVDTAEQSIQSPDAGNLPIPGVDSTNPDITLQDLEQLALSQNPAIAQADARVRALRGKWVQVGLPPNPSAGYMAAEIGDEGRAGQQGGYVGQDFITGGKLGLNRAVVSQEIQQAEQNLAAMQLRTQTDVRKAYYSALVAQRRADLAADLARVSGEAVKASQELLQAEEIPQAGLLQTQVEQQNASILALSAQNEQQAAWRQLSAVVGSELAVRRLSGDVSQLPALLDWNEQLVRVTSTSPEVSAAMASTLR